MRGLDNSHATHDSARHRERNLPQLPGAIRAGFGGWGNAISNAELAWWSHRDDRGRRDDRGDHCPPADPVCRHHQSELAIERRESSSRSATCQVACLGDSLVKIGVLPEAIRAESGLRTYNFALAQAPSPATYFWLRRLLDAGGRPEVIVLDTKPSILAGGPKYSLRRWQEVLTLAEIVDLVRESGSLGLGIEIALGRALPSYRDRVEIREAIAAGWSGTMAPTHETNRLAEHHWSINLGGHLNDSDRPFVGPIAPETHGKLLTRTGRIHPLNARYIERTLKLAQAYQIPVYWLIPPLVPELQQAREQGGSDAGFEVFVRSLSARYPMVTVVDGRHAGYTATEFADHTHLNGRGSNSLSRDLAAILVQRPATTRWVNLPPYRDRPIDFPGETITQSRRIVDAVIRR